MANTKVIAVAIVAVLLVGAVVAVFATKNGKDSGSDVGMELLSADVNPVLEVYGNVNEDLTIDEKDVEILEKALKDGTASNYKYADANFDGTVDEKDVQYIRDIIAATPENQVVVKHLNRLTTGDYYVETKYPISAFAMSGSANIFMIMKYVGLKDEIKAISYSGKIDSTLYSEYQYLFSDSSTKWDPSAKLTYRVGASAGYMGEELLANHIINDGITAIITADNANQYLSGASSSHSYGITEEKAESLGLDVIRISSAVADPSEYISNVALVSFLTQKGFDVSGELTEWYAAVIKDMNKILTDHVGKNVDAVNVAVTSSASYSKSSDGTVTTYNYISSHDSDYTKAALAAGGLFSFSGYDFGDSSSSKKMTDLGKWLIDYDIDKLIHYKTGSKFSWYGGDALTKGKSTLQQGPLAFSDTEMYHNGEIYVVSGDMPVILRTIYTATILYPELFSDDWALQYNIDHSKKFFGMSEDTVRNGVFKASMSDLGLTA